MREKFTKKKFVCFRTFGTQTWPFFTGKKLLDHTSKISQQKQGWKMAKTAPSFLWTPLWANVDRYIGNCFDQWTCADILQCLSRTSCATTIKRPTVESHFSSSILFGPWFLLRKHFRKACHEDAKEYCDATDMSDTDDEDLVIPLSLIIGCLYRHIHVSDEDSDNSAGQHFSKMCQSSPSRDARAEYGDWVERWVG